MSVELKPGEWKMRNGDKAVVLGKSPFSTTDFRHIGCSQRHGCLTWKDGGRFKSECESQLDIIAPWTDATPKYRPYRADELDQLRGVWLSSKLSSDELSVIGIDKKHCCVSLCGIWHTTKDLLGDYTHLDGTPCGVLENGGDS